MEKEINFSQGDPGVLALMIRDYPPRSATLKAERDCNEIITILTIGENGVDKTYVGTLTREGYLKILDALKYLESKKKTKIIWSMHENIEKFSSLEDEYEFLGSPFPKDGEGAINSMRCFLDLQGVRNLCGPKGLDKDLVRKYEIARILAIDYGEDVSSFPEKLKEDEKGNIGVFNLD